MLTYTVRLPGARTLGGRLPGRVLGDLMHALSRGAAGALRLRVEGRSATRVDRLPGWVERGTDFAVTEQLNDRGEPGVVLVAPSLEEALPERFEQGDLFTPFDARQSAIGLLTASLADAVAHRVDSDAFDADLLGAFARDFARLFRRDRVQGVAVHNGVPDSPRLRIDVPALRAVTELRDRTPRPRRVRVAGRMDEARHSRGAFVVELEDGARVRGVLVDQSPDLLKAHFGEAVIVEGTAQFRPSGRLLRVDVEHIAPARPADLRVFSTEPQPLDARLDSRSLRRPQTAKTGLNAVFGRWPGDETDEQIDEYLRDIS